MLKPDEVRELFRLRGIPVAQWARDNGFPPGLVYRVLRGEARGARGRTHQIATALGVVEKASPDQELQMAAIPGFRETPANTGAGARP